MGASESRHLLQPRASWRQLTELVANVARVPVRFVPTAQNGGAYVNTATGAAFDPVRHSGDCAELAWRLCVKVEPRAMSVTATALGCDPRPQTELYENHGGDIAAAARLATCRAIIAHYEALQP